MLTPMLANAASGPLVLYTFGEGKGSVVHDVSGNGAPLDLNIQDVNNIRWLAGGGLSVDKATIISGTGTNKITDAVKASNAISIEAWVKPENTTQDGPARIVTLSADTRSRNVTLAQKQAAYDVRLRSSNTDINGKRSLTSPSGTLSTSLTHVVYTRDKNGVANLYVNGNKQSQNKNRGDFSNWDTKHGFALANELTQDRPWLGELYSVAIYDRALDATDVDKQYAQSEYSDSSIDRTSYSSTSTSTSTSTSSDPDSRTTDTTPKGGSTTLSWSAPVARSDGSALSMREIAGYNLYVWGPDSYSNTININDAYTTSTSITDLASGTYYFAMTALDTEGLESSLSSVATKVVN